LKPLLGLIFTAGRINAAEDLIHMLFRG